MSTAADLMFALADLGPRVPKTEGSLKSVRLLQSQYETLGFTVFLQHFPQGTNIVCRKRFGSSNTDVPENSDAPIIFMGSHYDTTPGSKGLGDNASGCSATWGAAHKVIRWFEQTNRTDSKESKALTDPFIPPRTCQKTFWVESRLWLT
jgi:hypothetical protein